MNVKDLHSQIIVKTESRQWHLVCSFLKREEVESQWP